MAKEPKEMVAIRLDPADRRRAKVIAERLGVNESDLLRYAIKLALYDLSPLTDGANEGTALVPAFLEHGAEKARWLDLDPTKLDAILHADLEDEANRVPRDDVRMILGIGQSEGYINWLQKCVSGEEKLWVNELPPSTYLRAKYVSPSGLDAYLDEQAEYERQQQQ